MKNPFEHTPGVNDDAETVEDKLRERIAEIGDNENDPDIADMRRTLPKGQKRSHGRDGVDRSLPWGPESGSHAG